MAMSRTLFYIKLKTYTGKSPQDFIRVIRLERAATLLRNGQSVTDTATLAGFENAKYFSTVFKKYFGVSPSKYYWKGIKSIKKGFKNWQLKVFRPFLYAVKPLFLYKEVLLQHKIIITHLTLTHNEENVIGNIIDNLTLLGENKKILCNTMVKGGCPRLLLQIKETSPYEEEQN